MRVIATAALALSMAAIAAAQTPGAGQQAQRAPAAPAAPAQDMNARAVYLFDEGAKPVEPFKILGNIYYVGAADLAVYLIATPQGHILLDSGDARVGFDIAGNMRKLGFNLSDVKVILNSHAHVDHIQNHEYLRKASGATVAIMEADVSAARSGHDESPTQAPGWEPIRVERVLKDGDEVVLGGTVMRAIWTPGHTPGATAWVATVREGDRSYQVLWGGPPTPVVGNAKYDTRAEDAARSFSRLRELKPDIILGGHVAQAWKDKFAALRAGQKPHPLLIQPADWTKQLSDAEANYQKRAAAARDAASAERR